MYQSMAERVSINEALPYLQGVVEWEELGLYLGLSDATIRDIRSAIGDVSTKRMVMISRWLQSDLEATWSKLAKALLKLNPPYKVLAVKIRQERGLSPEPEDAYPDKTIRRVSKGEIKRLFVTLLADVRKALQSHNIDMADLLEYMKHFFKKNECFANVTNISDTLAIVSDKGLWSYQNYSPLEMLIKRFLQNDPETKKLMTKYKSQLTGYLLATKLIDYIKEKNLPGGDDRDQSTQFTWDDYTKIKVVIQLPQYHKISDLSLMYVQELWSSLAEDFNIPSLTAIVDDIALGSLEITWCLPPHEAELIKPTARVCRKHKITIIAIDDHIIYNDKQMVEYDRRFLKLCRQKNADISNFFQLLQLGVDPNIYDKNGIHPLWWMSYNGRGDLVQLLMDYDAAIDLQTDEEHGETALHAASTKGNVNVITILVRRGADVNSLTKTGVTPLKYASNYGHIEAADLLLNNGAEFNKGHPTVMKVTSAADIIERKVQDNQDKMILGLFHKNACWYIIALSLIMVLLLYVLNWGISKQQSLSDETFETLLGGDINEILRAKRREDMHDHSFYLYFSLVLMLLLAIGIIAWMYSQFSTALDQAKLQEGANNIAREHRIQGRRNISAKYQQIKAEAEVDKQATRVEELAMEKRQVKTELVNAQNLLNLKEEEATRKGVEGEQLLKSLEQEKSQNTQLMETIRSEQRSREELSKKLHHEREKNAELTKNTKDIELQLINVSTTLEEREENLKKNLEEQDRLKENLVKTKSDIDRLQRDFEREQISKASLEQLLDSEREKAGDAIKDKHRKEVELARQNAALESKERELLNKREEAEYIKKSMEQMKADKEHLKEELNEKLTEHYDLMDADKYLKVQADKEWSEGEAKAAAGVTDKEKATKLSQFGGLF